MISLITYTTSKWYMLAKKQSTRIIYHKKVVYNDKKKSIAISVIKIQIRQTGLPIHFINL